MFYQISIDGSEKHHNITRPHVSNKDSFEKITKNLVNIKQEIQKKRFTIGLRINVSKENFDDIEETIEYFSSLFGNDSRFQIIWQWVRDWGGEDKNSIKRNELKGDSGTCRKT